MEAGDGLRFFLKKKMILKNNIIPLGEPDRNDPVPYKLLLLADPSKDLIDKYLKQSDIFLVRHNDVTIGIIIPFPLTAEINIAVRPDFQGQGIGRYLIENAAHVASCNRQKSSCIGTANSSIDQLYLYQKLGFEITGIKRVFIDNYADPIFKNWYSGKVPVNAGKTIE